MSNETAPNTPETQAGAPNSLDKDMAKVIELLTSIDNHLRSMSGIPSRTEMPEVPGSGLREASAGLPDPHAGAIAP